MKLDKHEKRHIRLQICELLDSHCRTCPERIKYRSTVCLNVCPISQEMRKLASVLEDDTPSNPQPNEPSQHRVQSAAQIPKRRWSAEEVFYLWHHRKVFTIEQLAERLNRKPKSVYEKLKQLVQKGGISDIG
ncbi:hypothetical protein [Geobacillus subterraneus]|uniref:hypothetical protein n=1 Tax=Geobacillus subterraneus TaxID=129338 RepID=UPI00160C8848